MHHRAEENPGKKLLAVSWAMPPLLLPQAIQIPRILKALSSFDWDITVLSAQTALIDTTLPQDEQLAGLTAGGYRSVTVRPPFLWRPLHSVPGYRLLRKLRLADEAWQRWATWAGAGLMKAEDFQALITFAQPWSDHLIGLQLNRRKNIPWIAHFSDPWVDSPYVDKSNRQYPRWCEFEEAIIRESDAVVFTTEHTVELVMRKYPQEYRNKVHIVPHGFDPNLRTMLRNSPTNKRLRIVSTGHFYANRTPLPLFRALERLNRTRSLEKELEVILVGTSSLPYAQKAVEMGLGAIIETRESAPFTESMQIAATGDVLLVIDAPSDGPSVFLPSKLIDYLVLDKLIFGITPLEGSSADLLRRANCPLAAPDDIPGIADAIATLLDQWRLGKLAVSPAFARVAREYEITRTTRILDSVLRQVTTRGSGAFPPVGNLAG